MGEAFNTERIVLRNKLTGNGAFRTEEVLQATKEKQKVDNSEAQ